MNSPDQALYFKDLLYAVLRSWRRLLLLAVAGGILLGGFALYRNGNAGGGSVTLTDKEIDAITKDVLANDPEAIRHQKKLDVLNRRILSLSDRLSNSLYLALADEDPASVTFTLELEPEVPTELALDTLEQRRYFLGLDYLRAAKSTEFYTYLSSESGGLMDVNWIHELVEAKLLSDRLMEVRILASDPETANLLGLAARDYFLHEIREHLDLLFTFDVTAGNLVPNGPDALLIREEREKAEADLALTADKAQAEREAMDEIVALALEEAVQGDPDETPTVRRTRGLVKYAAAGVFAGLLLAVFWAVYRASVSGVIRYPQDFANQAGLLYIGRMETESGERPRSPGARFDAFLARRFYGAAKDGEALLSKGHAAALIASLGKERSISSLALVGGGEEAALLLAGEVERESQGQIRAFPAGLGRGDDVRKLAGADAALLLVTPLETRAEAAFHQLEMARGMGRKIMGILAQA